MNQIIYLMSIVVLVVASGCQQFTSSAANDAQKRIDSKPAVPTSQPADENEVPDSEVPDEREVEPTDSDERSPSEGEDPTDSDDLEPEDDDVEPEDDDQDNGEPEDPPSK